jgi:hypothetical protein
MILFDLWSHKDGVIQMTDITSEQWAEVCAAAKFHDVSGRRADTLLSDERGLLVLIDTCDEAHQVDPLKFVAVAPNHGKGAV